MDFLTIKITLKKVSINTVDISTREITSKKVGGNNVDFSTIEITSEKARGNNADFLNIEITSIKVRGNDVFLDQRNYIKKIHGNDVEIRRNLVFDVSRRNIHVKSTSSRRGVPVGNKFY